MQEQHQEQITEIRKAGHDALAVIVEEYKVWWCNQFAVEFDRVQYYGFGISVETLLQNETVLS